MDPAISVEHVSKKYRLGTIGAASLTEDFSRLWARLRGRPDPTLRLGDPGSAAPLSRREFWALQDVNFTVPEGEVVGIIGRNGAGKSTLLKILSRVTAPTAGTIRLRGRVASLLEVGTGFHQDLTGRENVFINGAIMGMTKAEIRAKFEEIVEFSECQAFIDTPVKRYSSGMYVRLAFAVAAHLDPEILIVDEVLAVGDAQFQKKCLGKMSDVGRGGRTVLFVSHNMVAVQSLCQKAILMRAGRVVADGDTGAAVAQYLKETHHAGSSVEWAAPEGAPGTGDLRIKSIRVAVQGAGQDETIRMTDPVRVETDFWTLTANTQLHLKYCLINDHGVTVLATEPRPQRRAPGLYRAAFVLPGGLLNAGGYALRLFIMKDENRIVSEFDSVVSFAVVDAAERESAHLEPEVGVIHPALPWVETELSKARIGSGQPEPQLTLE